MEIINQGKTILLISSYVIRGSVGIRASGFALETLGYHVWSLPTVTLTWHPGQGKAHRFIPSQADFTAFADDIVNSVHTGEIDGIMSGYFASSGQVEIAAQLIKNLKKMRPDLLYFCDPVMADEEGLYISEDIAVAIKKHLVPICDILKPNRSELEWLFDKKFNTNDEIIGAVRASNIPLVLVTSVPALLKNATANLLVQGNKVWLAEHRLMQNPVNGLGDLTSALFLSHYCAGINGKLALQLTTAAVFDCLCFALQKSSNELLLEQSYPLFMRPHSHITLRAL